MRGNAGHSGGKDHLIAYGGTSGYLRTACGRVVTVDTGYVFDPERGANCVQCTERARSLMAG